VWFCDWEVYLESLVDIPRCKRVVDGYGRYLKIQRLGDTRRENYEDKYCILCMLWGLGCCEVHKPKFETKEKYKTFLIEKLFSTLSS
jgi:hypothetical protein